MTYTLTVIIIILLIGIIFYFKDDLFDFLYWNDKIYMKKRTVELQKELANIDKKTTKYLLHFLDL